MMSETFQTHPVYYWLTAIATLLLLLLSWHLLQAVTLGSILFVCVAGVATIWFASALGTQVRLSPAAVAIHMPLRSFALPGRRKSCTIDYRQLVSIDQSGRFLAVLTVLYYPRRPDGLLDLEQLAAVTLPLITDQAMLRERLEAAIPR
jgi:hypothetical protein